MVLYSIDTLCTFGVGLFKNILKKKFNTFPFQQNYSPISHVIANYHDLFLINYLPKVQFHEKILSSS